MTTGNLTLKSIIIFIAISTNACSPETPKTDVQVNDSNCKPENIKGIKDTVSQQQLAHACARRGEFKPSEKKSW